MWQFWPQYQFWLGLRWRGTLSEVPRVIFLNFFFFAMGAKLLQMQNLGGRFEVFFLGGQNRNSVKVRGLKTAIKPIYNDH